jgi:hypothetical protein
MEQLHSKSSVSPASGYSFPSLDKENPSLFNEGVPNKPGVKDGFELATKDKTSTKGSTEIKTRSPLGFDVALDTQFLPKTGIQERFLKCRPVFKGTYSDYEHIGYIPNPELGEIYRKKMEDAANSNNERVVYDSTELSPYYNNSGPQEERYFDESKYVHPVVTEQDRKPGAYAPEGYFKFKEASVTHGVMRYYSDLNPYYKLKDDNDTTLVFESRFESGNLKRVIQTGDYEYDLYLNPDFSTGTFTQWYFFRITNTRKGRIYQFTIKNYQKSNSLYNQGMMPLMYSRKEYEKHKRSWQRTGEDIFYYQNPCKKKSSLLNYCMTFNISFKYDHDEAYMSHCYPYTYSDLKAFINKK